MVRQPFTRCLWAPSCDKALTANRFGGVGQYRSLLFMKGWPCCNARSDRLPVCGDLFYRKTKPALSNDDVSPPIYFVFISQIPLWMITRKRSKGKDQLTDSASLACLLHFAKWLVFIIFSCPLSSFWMLGPGVSPSSCPTRFLVVPSSPTETEEEDAFAACGGSLTLAFGVSGGIAGIDFLPRAAVVVVVASLSFTDRKTARRRYLNHLGSWRRHFLHVICLLLFISIHVVSSTSRFANVEFNMPKLIDWSEIAILSNVLIQEMSSVHVKYDPIFLHIDYTFTFFINLRQTESLWWNKHWSFNFVWTTWNTGQRYSNLRFFDRTSKIMFHDTRISKDSDCCADFAVILSWSERPHPEKIWITYLANWPKNRGIYCTKGTQVKYVFNYQRV